MVESAENETGDDPQFPVWGSADCTAFHGMIPLNEKHLLRLLSEWVRHYNAGCPHTSLGPGIPAEAATAVGLVHAYDPEMIVIGSGVMKSANAIIPYIESYVHR